MTEPIKVSEKPWGLELLLYDSPLWRVKVLRIKPHARLSLQYHPAKQETMYYPDGRVHVLRPMMVHRPCNDTDEYIDIVEVSTGPEETIRLEDDYGRK